MVGAERLDLRGFTNSVRYMAIRAGLAFKGSIASGPIVHQDDCSPRSLEAETSFGI
jgi:hypothetical protein